MRIKKIFGLGSQILKNQMIIQRKRSTSLRKNSKKKSISQKKKQCQICEKGSNIQVLIINHSLFKKYSYQHISELNTIDKYIKQAKNKQTYPIKQYLEKYYKNNHRKHQFRRVKQIYKLHHESPRLFMPEIREIITKCYHRKRLLEYFRIAKILGIRVDTIKFSTFLLSLSRSKNIFNKKQPYDRLIGQISGYEFSEEVQRQLIETLSGKQNNFCSSNFELQHPLVQKCKNPIVSSNFNQARLKI